MIPALQASRRASAAEIRQPVSVTATPSPGDQGVVAEGDDQGERGSVHARQVGQVVLDQLHQPVPEQGGVRQLLPGFGVDPAVADPAGAGDRLQRFLQRLGVQGGQLERAVAGAVAVVADAEVRERPGLGFFLLELLAFGLVGGFGADHFEQPLAELLEGGGVEHLGLVDHVRLGPLPGASGEVVVLLGERLDRTRDDRGFLDIDQPGRESLAGGGEGLVELLGQVQVPVSGRGGGLRRVRQPRRRRRRPTVGADLVAVGLHQHFQPKFLEASRGLRQLDQSPAFLLRGHRPDRHLGEPVERTRQRRREPHHRMRRLLPGRLPGGRWRRNQSQRHGPTLGAAGTPAS